MVSLRHYEEFTVPTTKGTVQLKITLSLLNNVSVASLLGALASLLIASLNGAVWAKSIGSAGMFAFGAVGYVCSRKSEALLPATQAKEALDSQLVDEIAAHEFVLRTRGLIQYQSPALPEYSGDRPIDESGWSAPGDCPSSDSLQLFDWQRFNTERDDFPHVAIAGKTGGGKSYLAEFLATLFEGYTIAVSPHWKKGDFTSADLVVGWGRNTGESAQFEHSFADIMTGQFNVSVGGFMYALLQEMDRRYQLDPKTQEYMGANDPEIVVILDEFNLYANLEGLPIITKQLLREARKVRIRLIPLVQGTEVKAMGVEGEGQLREQLTFIRVKNKAKEFADQEFSKHCRDEKAGYWGMVKNFISSSRYSCFVEDMPAQIPDLTEWKKQQPPLAKLAGFGVQQKISVCEPEPFTDGSCTDAQVADLSTKVCPNCGSEDVRTNGKTSSGATRYRCKSCDKSWSEK